MNDGLADVLVDVRCHQCGDFTVAADAIAESQQLLETGCPGSPYECPVVLYASLLAPAALDALKTAWNDLGRSARASRRPVTICDALCVSVRHRAQNGRAGVAAGTPHDAHPEEEP